MTQSSCFLTNGVSLEDCHTNFFALADLCGIKWRQYTCDKHLNDLEDPIINSYIKCINSNLLCVWRKGRCNSHQDQPNRHGQENYTKELWVFWYGEEPPFAELISNQLKDGEQGSWESGLSYECRTNLFKALHNLIERSLLSKGYAKLGRWFFLVKYNSDQKGKSDKLNDETQITFTFNFFLHGDSNVCTNVDVREHAAIYPLSKEDFHLAQSIPDGLRVVLAPFGLQAYFNGHILKDSDQSVQRFSTEWKSVYPMTKYNSRTTKEGTNISKSFNNINSNDDQRSSETDFHNKVVEVTVGDCKLRYPVCYIFVTEADRKVASLKLSAINDPPSTKRLPEALSQLNKKWDQALITSKMTSFISQIPSDTSCLKSNTKQANNFCDTLFWDKINPRDDDNLSSDYSNTPLNDLLLKKACNCQKCLQVNHKKQLKSANLNGLSSFTPYSSKSKDRIVEKEKSKYLKNSSPFHYRSSQSLIPDMDFDINTCSLIQTQSVSSPINSTVNINSSMNQSNPTPIMTSYKSPVSTSTSSILNTPGIESSSPLSNSFNLDATEHTSPTASKDEGASINTPTNITNQLNQSPKDKACPNALSPNGNSNSLLNSDSLTLTKNENSNVDIIKQEPPLNHSQVNISGVSPNGTDALPLKRPFLYKNIYEDDHDLRHSLLYDFTCEHDTWDLPIPKNRRIKDNANITGCLIDLDKDFGDSYGELSHFRHKDPYEFDDPDNILKVGAVNSDKVLENVSFRENGIIDLLDNNLTKVKSEHEMLSSRILMNSKQFIGNEDEIMTHLLLYSPPDENIENLQSPNTPKMLNGTISHTDTDFINSLRDNNSSILSKGLPSFETPPSSNGTMGSVASPCNNMVTTYSKCDKSDTTQDAVHKKETVFTNAFNEEFKDFYVYKPPIHSEFVAPDKYAPLENLESRHNLPLNCYYKHNIKKQQAIKSFALVPQNSPHLGSNLGPNKAKQFGLHFGSGKMNPFPNSMIRNVRPSGPTMPVMNSPYNRVRALNIQSQMYNFQQNDNFHGNLRQNSPNLNLDGSMSPMSNNFISSPVPNFDNRKSPYPFPPVSLNSPSNQNAFIPNSPMNYNLQQKMSPIVNSNNFYMNSNMDNSNVAGQHLHESNSVMLNLLLSDSMFNLFRDHNFESCSICVCNMNIKGNDVGVYLPDNTNQQQSAYDYYQCTCGFSALTNRHLSQFSGLFYEDEVEITGIVYDPSDKGDNDSVDNGFYDKDLKKALTDIDENLIDQILSLSSTIFSSSSTFSKLIYCNPHSNSKIFNFKENSLKLFERDPLKLVFKDCSDVVHSVLNTTRVDSSASKQNMHMVPASRSVLHDWAFRSSSCPVNNHEVIYTLKTLQPLMQEAVQRKGSSNEVTYNTVKGPLTWRQFHRLAGRGTENMGEPQPIPSLLTGFDKDCVVLSPFALKFWEKLSLEPYAITRDVAYIVLAPDNEFIINSVRHFFKELSTMYEVLRFGRHFPLKKVVRDGIFVVEPNNLKKCDSIQDDWYNNLGESNLASKIKLYAQACFSLVPGLSVYEKSLFESTTNKGHAEGSNSSFMSNNTSSMNGNLSNSFMSNSSGMSSFNSVSQRPMNNFSHVQNSESHIERLLNDIDSSHNSSNDPSICQVSTALQPYEDDDDSHKYPSIVIYIVDPFAPYGKDAARLGCLGLVQAFSHMHKLIPENVRSNVHFQLLSLDSVICNDKDFRNVSRQNQLKELSSSIYCQCKQQLIFRPNVKSLTGLGPAAANEVFLSSKDPQYNKTQLHTTPFILAPLKDKQTELCEMFSDRREKTQILYCCYCLSEDQKWLMASCTNDKGDILQTKIINIHVPNRTRRRNASVRRFGFNKLMHFVQTVMSESVLPWRLVIGRLGRMGHGELKDWTCLLSKKSLLKYSRQLRDLCAQCRDLGPTDQPAVYSACLISLEADTSLRVFNDHYTPDERFSSSCNTCALSTPEDASCTHILVFPTSATTQSSHANFNMMDIGANMGEDFFTSLDETDIPVEDELDFDNFWGDDALLGDEPVHDEPQPDSSGNIKSFGSSNLKNSNLLDDQDEPAQLLQQPLALAFYVSTARTGPLPRWFWINSPQLENISPTFLKSALLIHTPFVQQTNDDLLHSTNRDCHPLDSSLTTDVLRCVLEGYNTLSWLALDPGTNDRLSCLPLHIQVLMQLYHSVQALI